MLRPWFIFMFFFFNDTATTEIYTLSLHDALPIFAKAAALGFISDLVAGGGGVIDPDAVMNWLTTTADGRQCLRSEEHTSELQSRSDLVCRLLLEKKKTRLLSSPSPSPTLPGRLIT